MDLNGIYASVNFPFVLAGIRRDSACSRRPRIPDLAMAAVRAWNQWHLEDGPGPPRAHHSLPDSVAPRSRGRRCDDARKRRARVPGDLVQRGPEQAWPSHHPLRHWDPIHAGLRRDRDGGQPSHRFFRFVTVHHPDAPPDVPGVLFFAYAIFAAVDWLFSRVSACATPTSRSAFPREESAGCPPCSTGSTTWTATTECTEHGPVIFSPAEVLQTELLVLRSGGPVSLRPAPHRIGVDHILLESDYPHSDSTWPETNASSHAEIGGLPDSRHPAR